MAKASDAGGVAARKGFEYQDHIAASYLIEMLYGGITQVECETTDDITVVWKDSTGDFTEYIQVKTTEGDKKWTIKELCAKATTHSIYTSSFDHDKTAGATIKFKIVSSRDIAKALSILSLDTKNRNAADETKLAKSITTSSKKYASPAGNDADFWVKNATWEVQGKLQSVETTNKKNLLQVAEKYGVNPTSSQNDAMYAELVKKAYDAGNASRITAAGTKIILYKDLIDWWTKELEKVRATISLNEKPYLKSVAPFLVEFHAITSADLKNAFKALEAGYDAKKWRSKELAEHMIEWLPEIALKASELSVLNHTNFKQYSAKARKAVKNYFPNAGEELVSDILLHICIRQTFGSEPIACKVFYVSKPSGSKSFPNAHIVRLGSDVDLWLGKSKIIYLSDFETGIIELMHTLKDYLDRDFLKEERQIIIDLKESQHLLPSDIDRLLLKNTPVDEFLKRICIPLLVLYDSPHLKAGFVDEYLKHLIAEVESNYNTLLSNLPATLTQIKIHVFTLPFDDTKKLIDNFNALI